MNLKQKYDLQAKRSDLTNDCAKLTALRSQTGLTTSQERELDNKQSELMFVELQLLNERDADPVTTPNYSATISTKQVNNFRNYVTDVLNGQPGNPVAPFRLEIEHRADPLLSSTNANLKTITIGSWNTLYSPYEQNLRDLGVKIMTNLNGNIVLPVVGQSKAGWISEAADGSTANLSPTNITMSPVRATITQSVTREFLASTHEENLNLIVQNLYNAIWGAVSDKFFDELHVDCAAQISTAPAVSLNLKQLTNLEASTGDYTLDRPAYVMRQEIKSYLKNVATLSNQVPIWNMDKVNEYPAQSNPSANQNQIYWGDWSKAVVGSWGSGIDVILDPFSSAASGKVAITVSGLFDTGVVNPRAFTILKDVSAA